MLYFDGRFYWTPAEVCAAHFTLRSQSQGPSCEYHCFTASLSYPDYYRLAVDEAGAIDREAYTEKRERHRAPKISLHCNH